MDLTRRGFLDRMARTAVAVGSLPLILRALGGEVPAFAAEAWPEADHYEKLSGRRVQCLLCPMRHVLEDGATGPCRTRTNHHGVLRTHAWDNPAIVRLDPIEKLPAAHFHPDSMTLTIATGGCNLRCLYCQNWQQSQSRPEDLGTMDLSAAEAIHRALERDVKTIAFSYTEPLVFPEYAVAIAKAAKRKGMRVVVATGGYVLEKPLLDFLKYVDAITIGLKAFTEECYAKLTERSLAHVLDTLTTVKEKTDVWLEITNLVVPTYNDRSGMIQKMCRWIRRELGPDVPLHFGRFVPKYRLKNLPQTPLAALEEARKIALAEGVRYVYISNVAPHEGNNTYCEKCGKPLIRRVGFKMLENRIKDGKCPSCGKRIPGVWN